jgi:hypothetical protein
VSTYQFQEKWKEQLVCRCAEGQIVFEMTMGIPAVYFPTEKRWNEIVVAPHWASQKRAEILAELTEWCARKNLPLHVDDRALATDPSWKPPEK